MLNDHWPIDADEIAVLQAPPFDWIDCDAAHHEVESWVRPAVTEAVRAWQDTRSAVTTWGFLHGDPAPGVFLHDERSNTCGIIDWASGVQGPLLHGLASAAMYVGLVPRRCSDPRTYAARTSGTILGCNDPGFT